MEIPMQIPPHHLIEIEVSDNITEVVPTGTTTEIEESINDTYVVHLQRRLRDVKREVREGIQSSIVWEPVWICRVPRNLSRYYNEIQPEIASIGPYHRDKYKKVVEFEGFKWHLLESLLSRAEPKGVDVRNLMQAMKKLERRARSFYSESISMSSDDFIEMMVLDGCFVVELFQQVCGSEDSVNVSSPIFRMPWLIPILSRDLLKLENQLPLFVLQMIFDLTIGHTGDPLNLLALKFFNLALPRSSEALKRSAANMDTNIAHLLHLFHSSYLPSISHGSHEYRPLSNDSDQAMPCVTRLRLAGIKFRPRRSSDIFLEIQFHKGKGVLEIPPITINEFTSTVFINCAALEQCGQHIPTFFSAYIAFMSCLINLHRDVAFLCEDGIISNFSDVDSNVALLFKKLGESVVFNIRECYLSKQFREVEAYYGSNLATWRRTYFSSPWPFISVVSAAVLLSLTVIQTVMAILSYKIHHN